MAHINPSNEQRKPKEGTKIATPNDIAISPTFTNDDTYSMYFSEVTYGAINSIH